MKVRIKNPYIGVPITYLGSQCLNQFKIVGLCSSAGYDNDIIGIEMTCPGDARPLINLKNTYARLLIKQK